MRGQGYDGVSNMGGTWNGLQALFLRDFPYAYHVHCFAHRLQSALVVAGGKVGPVYCFFSNLNKILNIVSASSKRHTELQSAQAIEVTEIGKGANQMGSLHCSGETRLSSHFDSICSLIDMYGVMITVLQYMSDEDTSYDTCGEAYDCQMVMRSFDFVFILHLMNKILEILNMLCRSLQQKSLDILNAMDLVSTTGGFLQLLRDEDFNSLLAEVKTVCTRHHIAVSNMDGAYKMGTGRSCQKVDSITIKHHCQFDIFNSVIDAQLAGISTRFKDETVELLKLNVVLDQKDNFKFLNKEHVYNLANKFYPLEFTAQEMIYLRLELQQLQSWIPFHERFQNLSTICELSQKLVETNKAQTYHLIMRLIHLVLTLHVTTATTEQAFSAMKHVKSVLQNKMEGDYLSDYMVIFIERDLVQNIDFDSVIDEFYQTKNRRVQLM